MIEIERKFLVKNTSFKKQAVTVKHIIQGFLNSNPHRTVRVRVTEEEGLLTVKGISNAEGTTRFEWETAIPVHEAKELLKLCEPNLIEKKRYILLVGTHTFEVDEFLGENQGLVIAEVELTSENEDFKKPNWLGKEVTGDSRYYNSYLSKTPYKNWGIF